MNRFLVALLLAALHTALFAAGTDASVILDDEEVVFRLETTGAGSVYIIGDFNGWNPTIDKMIEVDGGFEIRLYLVPGRYRYKFMIDGEAVSDPGNEHVDPKGNSYFIFYEREGEYSIVYRVPGIKGGKHVEYVAEGGGEGYVRVGPYGAVIFSEGHVNGAVGDRADFEIKAGLEYEASENTGAGVAYNLRGLAGYDTGKGMFTAFSRSVSFDMEDPISLFGQVGPYDYPLGIFCRGIGFEGAPLFGIDTRLYYISRIDGYLSGLERAPDAEQRAAQGDLFAVRDPTDTDIITLKLGADIGPLYLAYLYRFNRRHSGQVWRIPGDGDDFYHGFEVDHFNGIQISMPGDGNLTAEMEFLVGDTYLDAREQSQGRMDDFHHYEAEYDWEEGYRFLTRTTCTTGGIEFQLGLDRASLMGEPPMRNGRQNGYHTGIEGGIRYTEGRVTLGLFDRLESFSSENTGGVFWIQRNNFWLDGDRLRSNMLPFLAAKSIYTLELTCDVTAGKNAYDYPYSRDLAFTTRYRRALESSPRFWEVLLRKGFGLHERITLLFDARFASYRHKEWTGDRNFLDVFAALHGGITHSAWCSIGVGVNPYFFDRWLYGFSAWGRERYMLDQGLFDYVGGGDTAAMLGALRNAEEKLAKEAMITFEAGIRF